MRKLVTLLLATVCLLALSAQEKPGISCDIPLVVTRFVPSSGVVELVKDLTAADLTVNIDGSPFAVQSLAVDGGPKRIALIMDASAKVPKDEWDLQTGMAASLMEHARAADTFSFFVVGADFPTGSSLPPADVDERLRKLAAYRPPVIDQSEKTYDALLAAVKSLDPPRFGDAIFLFGHPEDFGSTASADEIEKAILENRLRFYAMSFTDPFRKALPRNFDPNKRLPPGFSTGKADEISHETGYFFSFHQVQALRIPGQSALLKGFLGDLYSGIAEPYRVAIANRSATGKAGMEITIRGAEQREIHTGDVHYPHVVYPCLAAAQALK